MTYQIINTKTGEVVATGITNTAYASIMAQALRAAYREEDFKVS